MSHATGAETPDNGGAEFDWPAILARLDNGESAAALARELDIPAATIRARRHRARLAGLTRPDSVGRDEWIASLERSARECAASGERARKASNELIAAGRAREARDMAVTGGIWIDKAKVYEQIAAAARTAPVVDGEVVGVDGEVRELPFGSGPPDDDERIDQVSEILAEIGVVGGCPHCPHCQRRDDDGSDEDPPRLPRLLPAPRAHPDGRDDDEFEPAAGPRRVVRVVDRNGEPAGPPRRRQPEPEPVGQAPGWRPAQGDEPELLEPDEVLARVHWEDRLWRP